MAIRQHAEQLRCMEVWGGNEPADRGVSLAGLDAVVYSLPVGTGASGGDVHYLSSCATGRITRLLVADVSGHGETVASTARSQRDLMRRFINFADQTRLIAGMNRAFSERDHGGRFATAIVATYWAPTRELVVCNAGHPRPMIYRAKRQTWAVLAPEPGHGDEGGASDIPLGIDADGSYTQFGVRLDRGDIVMLYTDALIEARSQSGEMLTERGLIEILNDLGGLSTVELKERLLESIGRFRGSGSSDDDTTVLLLTPNDAVPRAGFGLGLLASARIVGATLASVFRGAGAMPLPQLRSDVIGGALVESMNRRRMR